MWNSFTVCFYGRDIFQGTHGALAITAFSKELKQLRYNYDSDKIIFLQLSFNLVVDPCVNYKVLSNADRRSSYVTVFNEMSCDSGFWGWYRFVGAAGTRMPDKCIRRHRCNTVLSGWLNDDHPSVEDGEISRRVCFSQLPYGCCRFILDISVINCGSYYIYRFVTPPKCPGRYCSTD